MHMHKLGHICDALWVRSIAISYSLISSLFRKRQQDNLFGDSDTDNAEGSPLSSVKRAPAISLRPPSGSSLPDSRPSLASTSTSLSSIRVGSALRLPSARMRPLSAGRSARAAAVAAMREHQDSDMDEVKLSFFCYFDR